MWKGGRRGSTEYENTAEWRRTCRVIGPGPSSKGVTGVPCPPPAKRVLCPRQFLQIMKNGIRSDAMRWCHHARISRHDAHVHNKVYLRSSWVHAWHGTCTVQLYMLTAGWKHVCWRCVRPVVPHANSLSICVPAFWYCCHQCNMWSIILHTHSRPVGLSSIYDPEAQKEPCILAFLRSYTKNVKME